MKALGSYHLPLGREGGLGGDAIRMHHLGIGSRASNIFFVACPRPVWNLASLLGVCREKVEKYREFSYFVLKDQSFAVMASQIKQPFAKGAKDR